MNRALMRLKLQLDLYGAMLDTIERFIDWV